MSTRSWNLSLMTDHAKWFFVKCWISMESKRLVLKIHLHTQKKEVSILQWKESWGFSKDVKIVGWPVIYDNLLFLKWLLHVLCCFTNWIASKWQVLIIMYMKMRHEIGNPVCCNDAPFMIQVKRVSLSSTHKFLKRVPRFRIMWCPLQLA